MWHWAQQDLLHTFLAPRLAYCIDVAETLLQTVGQQQPQPCATDSSLFHLSSLPNILHIVDMLCDALQIFNLSILAQHERG